MTVVPFDRQRNWGTERFRSCLVRCGAVMWTEVVGWWTGWCVKEWKRPSLTPRVPLVQPLGLGDGSSEDVLTKECGLEKPVVWGASPRGGAATWVLPRQRGGAWLRWGGASFSRKDQRRSWWGSGAPHWVTWARPLSSLDPQLSSDSIKWKIQCYWFWQYLPRFGKGVLPPFPRGRGCLALGCFLWVWRQMQASVD